MPLTIRPATQDDQPAIRRVIAEVHLPRMNLQWPNFVVVEEDREIVGMGQVKSHRDGSRELASIAVVPKRQGDGVGTAVIEALLGREVRAVLHLSCRRELETYYERFGFKRVEQAEYPVLMSTRKVKFVRPRPLTARPLLGSMTVTLATPPKLVVVALNAAPPSCHEVDLTT